MPIPNEENIPEFFFRGGGVSVIDLNKVSKQAFGMKFAGNGIEITRRGDVIFFSVPNQRKRFNAKVYLFDDTYYGYYSEYGGDCAKLAYRFQELDPARCGEYVTRPWPAGLVGDGFVVRAFERNDLDIDDGMIVEMEHHISYYDPQMKVFRHEYMFSAPGTGTADLGTLPETDQYEGYGDSYYGDGCEITDQLVIDATRCVNGVEITERITVDSLLPMRICREQL